VGGDVGRGKKGKIVDVWIIAENVDVHTQSICMAFLRADGFDVCAVVGHVISAIV
jgi:hypothetical protein